MAKEKVYDSEAAVRELLRVKYSKDEVVVDIYLETKQSLLGNVNCYQFVKKYPKIHAELGVTEADAWREIAGLIFKCYG